VFANAILNMKDDQKTSSEKKKRNAIDWVDEIMGFYCLEQTCVVREFR